MYRHAAAIVLATVLLTGTAGAAEVRVLTAGAFKEAVLAVAQAFVARTGDTLSVQNETTGVLEKRILGGEAFDVTFLPPRVIDSLIAKGKIEAGTQRDLARTGVGVVVAPGTAMPDVSTVAALRQALLAAKSIAYIDPASGGSSGVYVARLLVQMGVADDVRAKTRLIPGGLVATHVMDGEAELGIHQISEIRAVKGAVLVGPLPEAIQSYTIYAGGVSTSAAHRAAAEALIALLGEHAGVEAIHEANLEPVR